MRLVFSTRTCLRSRGHQPAAFLSIRSLSIFSTFACQPTLTGTRSSVFKPAHPINRYQRAFSTTPAFTMSFSNAETGNKPADPYTAKNKEDPSLAEKVEGLTKFVDSCKFAMMTTRIESRGLLVSRAMAVAGKVRTQSSLST